MKTDLLPHDAASITRAAKLLALDELVALPTETVYGLAGNAFSDQAVQKIFAAKERPSFDPLIVHISERYLHDPHGIIPALVQDGILAPEILSAPELTKIHAVMKQCWPGPLTFILPRGSKIPDSVSASQPTVGIRCPDHPVFQAILSRIPFPLAAPSANRFGRISPTESSHVMSELGGRIPAIVDGGLCEVGLESTIIKIDFPFRVTMLRPGKISLDELKTRFQSEIHQGVSISETLATKAAVTPGSLDEHYAPRKPLYLLPHSFFKLEETQAFLANQALPKKLALLSMHGVSKDLATTFQTVRTLSASNKLSEIAHFLFKTLRELDENPEVDAILSDLPEELTSGLGSAIADRLRRASRNKPQF